MASNPPVGAAPPFALTPNNPLISASDSLQFVSTPRPLISMALKIPRTPSQQNNIPLNSREKKGVEKKGAAVGA